MFWKREKKPTLTLFFATDVHGSTICWKKFIHAAKFYNADVLILGGDMTGKALVPIVRENGHRYRVHFLEQEFVIEGEEALREMKEKITNRGYYPYVTTPDEIEALRQNKDMLDALFKREVLKRIEEWLAYADEKLAQSGVPCYVAPGNDDFFEIDELIRESRHVCLADGQVIELDPYHEMISSGWSNRTPWHTFREADEEDLLRRYEAMIRRMKRPETGVFNFHVPPYRSTLDEAPELTEDLQPKYAGRALVPVGSTATRQVIETYQPLLGLFGHIHEARGVIRIGRTLCINPGSAYEQGRLLGALVTLEPDRVKHYVLTMG